MPELPEVETVCRGLRNNILGDSITAVNVLRKDSIGHPSPREFAKKLPGHVIKDVRRRGKYILIDLDNDAGLICHLRMSGRFIISPKGRTPNAFLRVKISLASGRELHFEDMRVFGRLWYVPPGENFGTVVSGLSTLGVEPLPDLSGKDLSALFRNRKQSVKSALLDQTLVAGVGNIYADESLFQAGIHPARPAGSLSAYELERLAETVKQVLDNAITLGGSTLRDYTSSEGVNGNYQHQAWVYGRTGEACRNCGKLIERMKIGGRSSHFCPDCQQHNLGLAVATKVVRTPKDQALPATRDQKPASPTDIVLATTTAAKVATTVAATKAAKLAARLSAATSAKSSLTSAAQAKSKTKK